MTIEEARLHIGFLVEELFSADEPEILTALGISINSHEPESGGTLWKVKLGRPSGRGIEFALRPITTKGWGADFEVLDSEAKAPLAAGYVCYLFSYLTWLFDNALEADQLSESETQEELTWQNEK